MPVCFSWRQRKTLVMTDVSLRTWLISCVIFVAVKHFLSQRTIYWSDHFHNPTLSHCPKTLGVASNQQKNTLERSHISLFGLLCRFIAACNSLIWWLTGEPLILIFKCLPGFAHCSTTNQVVTTGGCGGSPELLYLFWLWKFSYPDINPPGHVFSLLYHFERRLWHKLITAVHSTEMIGRRSIYPRPKGSEAAFESYCPSGDLFPVNWCH